MQISEERIRAVEKVLKEPIAAQFSDQAWKIRTNLIIASSIALVMGLAQLHITADSSFLGLKFSGLSDVVIRFTLAAVIVYLLFHFLWVGWDSFVEWRLRITGTRTLYQTGGVWGPDHADYPVDPRQSTLYNWWSMQQSQVAALVEIPGRISATCEKWVAEFEKMKQERAHAPDWTNLSHILSLLQETKAQCVDLGRKIEENTKAITDDRIPTSLRRFDGWFQLFLRSQNLRWLVIEFVAPIALSLTALYQLLE
jgi:hypothetical protein